MKYMEEILSIFLKFEKNTKFSKTFWITIHNNCISFVFNGNFRVQVIVAEVVVAVHVLENRHRCHQQANAHQVIYVGDHHNHQFNEAAADHRKINGHQLMCVDGHQLR